MKRPEIRIPTLLGLVLAVGGLVVGLRLVGSNAKVSTSAAEEQTPKSIQITNIGDSGFVVSWQTDTATAGYIKVREDGLGKFEQIWSDDRDQKQGEMVNRFTHLVEVKKLRPETKYVVQVGSGRTVSGPIQVATGPVLKGLPKSSVVFGQVVDEGGNPAAGAMVYLSLPKLVMQAALTNENGGWVIPLAGIRQADLKSYGKYDAKNEVATIKAVAGQGREGKLTAAVGNGTPFEVITIGEVAKRQAPISVVPSNRPGLVEIVDSKFGLNIPSEGQSVIGPRVVVGYAPAGSEIKISIDNGSAETVLANEKGGFELNKVLTSGKHVVAVVGVIDGKTNLILRSFVKP